MGVGVAVCYGGRDIELRIKIQCSCVCVITHYLCILGYMAYCYESQLPSL